MFFLFGYQPCRDNAMLKMSNPKSIHKEIRIDASIDRVFKALTDSEEIPRFFPLNEVNSKWLVGSEVLYHGEINGKKFTDFGVIEKLEPPNVYSYRYWSDNHGTERVDENDIKICYSLQGAVDGTLLKVSQTNIKSSELYEIMDSQVWSYLLSSLKKYLEQ